MATTARIARVLIVAAGILALSVTAAQARPIGVGYTGQSPAANLSTGHHSVYGKSDAARKAGSVMSPAVDPANAQQVPIVLTQPVKVSDTGFSWTAGMLGAGTASLVLLLAAITATRIRPRRVAQL